MNNAKTGNTVTCFLCPHHCQIPEGAMGFCGARRHSGGEIVPANYGQISSMALDPIEKKPLRMFHPGEMVLSIGSFGCNLRCPFCQNSGISLEYGNYELAESTPEEIAALALSLVPRGNMGVAYTYNEPLVGYEFVRDCAKAVHEAGLKNIIVTNGYINLDPLLALLPYVDAMNIDLKGFDYQFYQKLGGGFVPVKAAIELASRHCHVEVTMLVIPGENEEHVEEAAEWLASVNPDIPLHLSRFFPRHKYSHLQPTPKEAIIKLSEKAKRHLNHVFTGNM